MSKRSEMLDVNQAISAKYGIIYTEILGWVDLGHASGDDIRNLLSQMELGENRPDEFYHIHYEQSMFIRRKWIGTSKYSLWKVRRGRSLPERHSIALAMMMKTGTAFESLQDSWPFSWTTDSGFSGEDLVSDLLGFYRAIHGRNYLYDLKPVSKSESIKRWDHYGPIGNFKNKGFRPLLFPDPSISPNSRPYLGELPYFMKSIKPYFDFKSGNVSIANDSDTGIYLNGGRVYGN
ncbi:hypothetical protein DDT52_17395 [Brenneria roseae subsp. roseae]|uniref:hypothetical protein n=1 Tax=Brenneria roseae TaxID=1509241 RepID=UPI000D60F88D|nr:hypothetical protein [Brenneria roseae]PWC17055.1 hypothetical protein DDT52_17395 [Brenneria roseae subsp. roseae]